MIKLSVSEVFHCCCVVLIENIGSRELRVCQCGGLCWCSVSPFPEQGKHLVGLHEITWSCLCSLLPFLPPVFLSSFPWRTFSQLSEYSPRVETYETSKCLGENSKQIRQGSCDVSFLKAKELFVECDIMLLPGIVEKSQLLQLTLSMCPCDMFLSCVAYPCDACFLRWLFLTLMI